MTEPYNYSKNPEGIAIENMLSKKQQKKNEYIAYQQNDNKAAVNNQPDTKQT